MSSLYDYYKNECEEGAGERTIINCSYIPGFPDVNLITNISGQRYEKSECKSNIAFVDKKLCEKLKDSINVELSTKVEFESRSKQIRLVRKLLECADENHCLVVCDNEVIGTIPYKTVKYEFVPVIRITGHMTWEAYIANQALFAYENGIYGKIKTEKFDKCELEKALKDTFSECDEFTDEAIDRFNNIIGIISDLNHGTSMVIFKSDDCKTEADRLCTDKAGHGMRLSNPHEMDNRFLSQVTRMDGGLLVDLSGKCHAVGCIFDGTVSDSFEGESSRGSRYNSVNLYVHNNNKGIIEPGNPPKRCVAVIVSDDSYVDII